MSFCLEVQEIDDDIGVSTTLDLNFGSSKKKWHGATPPPPHHLERKEEPIENKVV